MPRLVRSAIEQLLAARLDHDQLGSPSPASIKPSEDAFGTILLAALAALVVRQARIALIDGRHISGVDRFAGDLVGLGREDRQAMAMVSRARLRAGQVDVGAEIHDVLFHCTLPLGVWLPLPSVHAERLSNVILLDPEERVPTREAEELAQRFVSTTASLEELLFSRFQEQLARSSRVAASGYYTRVREFVVRHPIVTTDQLARVAADLPSAINVLITQQFYEAIPEGWGPGGELQLCAHCGNALKVDANGVSCRTRSCAETLSTKRGRTCAVTNALRLTRGIRLYWQEPGFDELRLYDELMEAGRNAVLYPHLDRVDIEVGEVGIDFKAYVSPELLASRIGRNLGGLAHYRHKWLAIPDRLVQRIPSYLERLRSALGSTPVRALTASAVAAELTRA
jgi:hypothetical protein